MTRPPVGKKIFMSGKTCLVAAIVHGILFALILRWLKVSEGFISFASAKERYQRAQSIYYDDYSRHIKDAEYNLKDAKSILDNMIAEPEPAQNDVDNAQNAVDNAQRILKSKIAEALPAKTAMDTAKTAMDTAKAAEDAMPVPTRVIGKYGSTITNGTPVICKGMFASYTGTAFILKGGKVGVKGGTFLAPSCAVTSGSGGSGIGASSGSLTCGSLGYKGNGLRLYTRFECENTLQGTYHANGECTKKQGGSWSWDCRNI